MKIMILANSDVGLYKFRKELIEALLLNCEVHIVLPPGSFVEAFTEMGCVYHSTEYDRHGMNPFAELSLLHKYQQIVNEVKPNIVLTYTIKPNIYGGLVCTLKDIPYIVNITGLGTAVEQAGFLQRITTVLYRLSLRKASKVFFQNSENMEFMKINKIVSKNFELIPGSGVNLNQYKPLPYPNGSIINFLFVARVMKEKGIDQYLEAAEYIRKKYENTRFHVCGVCEQDYGARLVQMSNAGIIYYHGAVADMVPMYRMSSCTIHPTYYPEGMSNVLLESCASARPIITTDRPGCREIIDDGVNGYLCESKNSMDLIEKIERFLALSFQERKTMGENGRRKVEREFDRNIVVNKYLLEIERNGCIQRNS